MIQFNLDPAESGSASAPFSVSVIGIGGSGTNVIDKIALEGMSGADLVSMNCDARSLNTSMAGTKIQLGKSLTQGLGCGGDPELGAEAALASQPEIREMLTGRNMVFLCVGLGGGTGSGAAPVIARMAREAGAFVVVFATLPFAFEGRRRSNQAGLALQDLRKYANALITFENDRMGELVVPKKGVQEAFELADKIIGQSVRAVTSLVTQPGLISIGMDDLITALRNTDSRCLFGYGQAKGENRAVEALGLAFKSPLLDRGQMLSGARNVLVHICGGTTLTLFEIETLMRELGKHVHEDAQILFGAATDPKLNENLSVTILTSLAKPVPVIEVVEAPAVVAPAPVEAIEAPAPIVPAALVEIPALLKAPVPVTEKAPKPVSAAPAAPKAAASAPVAVVDEELFPEAFAVPAPVAEPMLIEIPALVLPAPVPVAPLVPQIEEEVVIEAGIPEDVEEPVAVTHVISEVEEPVPVETPVEEYAIGEEDLIEAAAPEPEPEPEPVPERIIRIERLPTPVARREPAAEAVRPIPTPPRQEPAAPPKRFALSDIIKREPKPVNPVVEYEAREDYEAPPAAPVRPAPAPVSRRAPDYDRVGPIRPIPAGRNTTVTGNSPFTAAKATPAPIRQEPAPGRPVPTQQQTFDERLQPASSGSRFERVKPTVEEGEDLDVPTFLRRKR